MSTESNDARHATIDPRYPIGHYQPKPFSEHQKQEWLNDIKFLPQLLENAILNLDEAQLQTPYRDGGWTVHQLVHGRRYTNRRVMQVGVKPGVTLGLRAYRCGEP